MDEEPHYTVRLLDGREFDEKTAPPWFDNYRPGRTYDPRWETEARVNRKLNDRGDQVANAILLGILALMVVAAIAFGISIS